MTPPRETVLPADLSFKGGLYALVGVLMALRRSVHRWAPLAGLVLQRFVDGLGHPGSEPYPRWWSGAPRRGLETTSTHHEPLRGSAGLHFGGWGRWGRTGFAADERRCLEASALKEAA